MPDAADWVCPYCGTRNNGHWLVCHGCGVHCAARRMKSQARLRLRQPGRHRGSALTWVRRHRIRTLPRAYEMNAWPRHYADNSDRPEIYCQMDDYVRGIWSWNRPSESDLRMLSYAG